MRLIDVDQLGIGKATRSVFIDKAWADGWNSAIDIINQAETVDAAPVVHGKWAHLGGDEWCCTNCGFVVTTEGSWEKPTEKYCPNCGAKMDLEEQNNA